MALDEIAEIRQQMLQTPCLSIQPASAFSVGIPNLRMVSCHRRLKIHMREICWRCTGYSTRAKLFIALLFETGSNLDDWTPAEVHIVLKVLRCTLLAREEAHAHSVIRSTYLRLH